MALKTPDFVTCNTVAASKLSNTFGSSTDTPVWISCDGVESVKFQLSSVALGTASEVRVTPIFRSKGETITIPYDADGTPVYWPLAAINRETPPFPTGGAYEVSCELWTDVAAGASGAATAQVMCEIDK